MKYFLICVTQRVTYSGFVKFSNIIDENAFPLGEIKANDPPLKVVQCTGTINWLHVEGILPSNKKRKQT